MLSVHSVPPSSGTMASRELARVARGPDDYHKVYSAVLSQADRPVILHWLGEMFDPQLAGYWGSRDIWQAAETVLALIREHATRVDGIKLSLLDQQHESALRAALPPGVRLYTGDDFNYQPLIVRARGSARGWPPTGCRRSSPGRRRSARCPAGAPAR